MAFLCVNTPHIDVYVKKEYLYDLQKGHGELVEGVWVTCQNQFKVEHYILKLIYLSMALYDKLPISAFVWKKDYEGEYTVNRITVMGLF